MQADRYALLKRISEKLQEKNEYHLTDEELVVIKLRGISQQRYLTETLIERMRAVKSPSEDKKP